MPSLHKKGKGGFYYAVFKDVTRRPKEKWVPLRVTLKSAAKLKFNDLQRRWADPNDPFDPWQPKDAVVRTLTMPEAVEAFLQSRSHRRPWTLRKYRSYLSMFARTLPAGMLLSNIDADNIRPFVWERGIAPNGLRARARHLKAFFSWAVKVGHLSVSPMVDVELPREEKKLPVYLTPEDVQRILRAIEADYDMKAAEGQAQPGEILWLRDVIVLAVSTGLRRSELCNLTWEAVNLEDRMLTVGHGHATKSHHQRPVPLAPPALDVLHTLHTPDASGYVIPGRRGGKLNGDYVGKCLKKYARLAKLPENVNFHALRHTCASWLTMNGVPLRVVQEILGHSSVQVTERYSHLAPGAMRAAVESTFAAL